MRYIFVTLVLVNAALAAWGLWLRDPVPAKTAPVADLPPVVKTVVQPSSEPQADLYAGDEHGERLCDLVGPFAQTADANAFVERLGAIDVEASVEQVDLPAGQSFWVHLPPEDSLGAAYRKLASLQSQGLESYVISKGELKNAISLGVFTYIDLANRRVEDAKAMGLPAMMTPMKRTQIEIWVMIRPAFAEKMSELTWQRMLEGMTLQERRQNFCLPVAS